MAEPEFVGGNVAPVGSEEAGKTPHNRLRLDRAVPIVLSFVAGHVDVISYLGLFHTFVAFVTGTAIIMGEQLVVGDGRPFLKSVVLLGFIISTAGWVHLIRRQQARRLLVPVLLIVEAGLLFLFFVLHRWTGPPDSQGDHVAILLALIGVTAMALQNALMALALRHHMPTTVMTGNLVRLLIFLLDAIHAKSPKSAAHSAQKPAPKASLANFIFVVLSFLAGILVGAAGYTVFGLDMMLFPAILLLVFSLVELAMRARPVRKSSSA
jgi:uncharacterized membrane protein YoaK (UPF0700 family)